MRCEAERRGALSLYFLQFLNLEPSKLSAIPWPARADPAKHAALTRVLQKNLAGNCFVHNVNLEHRLPFVYLGEQANYALAAAVATVRIGQHGELLGVGDLH